MSTPIGHIDPVRKVACPTCRKLLSDNAMELALQGKSVRCQGCRMEIKLSADVIAALKKSRRS